MIARWRSIDRSILDAIDAAIENLTVIIEDNEAATWPGLLALYKLLEVDFGVFRLSVILHLDGRGWLAMNEHTNLSVLPGATGGVNPVVQTLLPSPRDLRGFPLEADQKLPNTLVPEILTLERCEPKVEELQHRGFPSTSAEKGGRAVEHAGCTPG